MQIVSHWLPYLVIVVLLASVLVLASRGGG